MSLLPDKDNLVGNPTAGQFKTALGAVYDFVDSLHFWGASKEVALGDVIFKTNYSSVYAKCTTAGITGTAEPIWTEAGSSVADGTAFWTMYEISTDVALSFRNKIINGNFAINQRVVSGTVTLAAGAYGHDRWKAGTSGCTYTFATVANVVTITILAGSLVQVIEGINLQSGTHTLSWKGTAQGKIGAGSYGASGVTGTATGGTNLAIEFDTGTLSNVQVEEGSVATTFEQRPITVEEMLCKRYYETPGAGWTNCEVLVLPRPVVSGATHGYRTNFKVPKRAVPTVVISAPDGTKNCIVAESTNRSATANDMGVNGFSSITNTSGTTWTDAQAVSWCWTAAAEL